MRVSPVLGPILGWTDQTWQQQSVSLACSYGALILSFLGGIHWGFATAGAASIKTLTEVARSLRAGLPWRPEGITLCAIIVGVLIYIYERRTTGGQLPSWYLPLRLKSHWGCLGLAGFLPSPGSPLRQSTIL